MCIPAEENTVYHIIEMTDRIPQLQIHISQAKNTSQHSDEQTDMHFTDGQKDRQTDRQIFNLLQMHKQSNRLSYESFVHDGQNGIY